MKLTLLLLLLVSINVRGMPVTFDEVDEPKKVYTTLSDGRVVEGTSGVICRGGCSRKAIVAKPFDKRWLLLAAAITTVVIIAVARDDSSRTLVPTQTTTPDLPTGLLPPVIQPPITTVPTDPQPQPVPEPTSVLLVTLGLATVTGYKRIKKSIWLRQSF